MEKSMHINEKVMHEILGFLLGNGNPHTLVAHDGIDIKFESRLNIRVIEKMIKVSKLWK